MKEKEKQLIEQNIENILICLENKEFNVSEAYYKIKAIRLFERKELIKEFEKIIRFSNEDIKKILDNYDDKSPQKYVKKFMFELGSNYVVDVICDIIKNNQLKNLKEKGDKK